MQNGAKHWRATPAVLLMAFVLATAATNAFAAVSLGKQQTNPEHLTPLQMEIEKQRQRLSSADIEERREALTHLGSMHQPMASRAALAALNDSSPIVRATASASILSLPADEAVANLVPLLSDKDEFVRQQAAYALGQTQSRAPLAALIVALSDKKDSVRGAAAVALGQIGDSAAVSPLVAVLDSNSALAPAKKGKKNKRELNLFVLRAAAHSLGQIGSPAALPTLIVVVQDEKTEDDVRREAAFALGEIGDASALPALRSVETARDPYLSGAAREAIRKISRSQALRGT